MPILETRSEVEVTVTKGWYATLLHPKMHAHTKVGIPTSNNMRYVLDTNILKTRSEVKVTVTQKMVWDIRPSQDAYTHLIWDSYHKEYRRYARDTKRDRQTDGDCNYYMPPKVHLGHKNKILKKIARQGGRLSR